MLSRSQIEVKSAKKMGRLGAVTPNHPEIFLPLKSSSPASGELNLLEELKSYSRGAFSELYDRYAGTLLGVIIRIVKNETEAEDVLQDTFVKIWKNIHQHDPDKGRLFTWLLRVARNTALDYLRAHKKDDLVELPMDGYLPDTAITLNPIGHIGFSDVIRNSLNLKYWVIIDLVYFQGYTHQQAADQLGLPVGTVKTWTREALLQLRRIFSRDQL